LDCPNGLMFLGLNPGGEDRDGAPDSLCQAIEKGNAYYTELWRKLEGKHPLQIQVQELFKSLMKSPLWKVGSFEQLLDETLTSNFCPFRSRSWAKMARKEEAIRFSTELWAEVLPEIKPRVIICMGRVAYSQLGKVLENVSARSGSETSLPTGWGQMKFAIQQYTSPGWNPILVRIPHLSQYKIMSRPQCLPRVEEFVAKLSEIAA
jgi:hypothetical protein